MSLFGSDDFGSPPRPDDGPTPTESVQVSPRTFRLASPNLKPWVPGGRESTSGAGPWPKQALADGPKRRTGSELPRAVLCPDPASGAAFKALR